MPTMKKFDKEELEELKEMEDLVCRSTSIYWEKNSHPRWDEYYEAANNDKEYSMIVEAIKDHKPFEELRRDHPARNYKKDYNDISLIKDEKDRFLMTLNGERMIIPQTKRRMLLNIAHVPHLGTENTTNTMKARYYWPSMSHDIENMTRSCKECRIYAKSQVKEPPAKTFDISSSAPMKDVGMDLFYFKGKVHLIMVDRFSSMYFVKKLKNESTNEVLRIWQRWMIKMGKCETARTDGGPCFASAQFRDFCRKHGIIHELSSPYNPVSNGSAERAVQKAKLVMKRASAAGGCIKTAIWAAQNIYLSKVGCSAADLFYRRVMTTDLPCLKRKVNFDECIQQRVANQSTWRQNLENKRKTNESDILHPGEEVDCQDAVSKLWNKTCKIVKKAMDSGNRYWVKFANSSRLRLRGRSLLRRIVKKATPDPPMLYKPENTSKPDRIGPLANVREKLKGAAHRLCPGSRGQCNTPVQERRTIGDGAKSDTRDHSPYNLRKRVQFRQ